MCELFAINAKHPVRANDYLAEFFTHSQEHRDGWGISWRLDDAQTRARAEVAPVSDDGTEEDAEAEDVYLFREAVPAYTSRYLPELLDQPILARRLEAHIRRGTGGSLCTQNCHPFLGSDISGREWTMIHNGILFNEGLLATYDLKEAGETDSERAMLFLLDVLEEATLRHGGMLDFEMRFQTLSSAIMHISNLNRLNLILDDGTYTYVHTNTSEDTLHFRQLDEDAIVFSTQPLGDEAERTRWQPVPKNRLIAYRDGRLQRTSTPHGYVFCEAILELRRVFGDSWTEVAGID